MTEGIQQPEGLRLMQYKCQKCGVLETIWNSRPRVTPFAVGCAKCEGTMHHADWEKDKYAPNHIPKKGDRIFVDWSREACEKYYKELIDEYWNDGDGPLSNDFKTKKDALKYYMDDWEFGHPVIETI